MTQINADFSARAVSHAGETPWVPAPAPGVERRMLDRVGDEVARATSLVRFAPGSAFPSHIHNGGEEFLVLEGVFQDEQGDFPAGSYVRNPPLSSHTPSASEGAVLFVKLWQFDAADRASVWINTNRCEQDNAPGRQDVSVIPLHLDEREEVRIEVWKPGAKVSIEKHKGLEILVLEGGFQEGGELFARHSWLRLPPSQDLRAVAGLEGTRVWMKLGHLSVAPIGPSA
ncbi:cupin domain-containing protein [Bosea psychrotolerans]|uniref:ChrR-like anti-ECFsigma factor n=1 Tax=Bosea psychrotolerans TaxID=1871628 RepID=A0A2S4M812_9HYPH|nr:cupin domain-containing protein [Bosea psychrotolerans]POR50844.1 ChrR-like anti-ECFsigma factor [Bosea psychrotolerans]